METSLSRSAVTYRCLISCMTIVLSVLAIARVDLAAQEGPATRVESVTLSAEQVAVALRELESKDEAVGQRAYHALLSARSQAAEFLPNILSLLDSANERARTRSIWLLIELGPAARAATPPLLARLGKLGPGDVYALLTLRALGAMGAPPEQIADAFRKTLANPLGEFETVSETIELRQYDPAGKWAVPIVAVALESSKQRTRERAAEELGTFGPKALPALDALLETIARVYPREGGSADTFARIIERACSNGRILDPEGSPAERDFLAFRDPCLWAIGQIGQAAEGRLKDVLEIAATGHVALRPDAIRVAAMIEQLGAQTSQLALRELRSQNPLIRLGAIDAIRLLSDRGVLVRPSLHELFPSARPYELRALCRTIEAIGWDSDADASKLAAVVAGERADVVSAAAAHRLGFAKNLSKGGAGALLKGLKNSSPWFASLCARSLGRAASPSDEVVSGLVATLDELTSKKKMTLWDDAKAAFVVEALAKLSRADRTRASVARISRRSDDVDLQFGDLSGLSQSVLRASCVMSPPTGLSLTMRAVPTLRVSTPWWAEWGQEPPGKAAISWMDVTVDRTVWMEVGEASRRYADWSTFRREFMSQPILLALRPGATPSAVLIEWKDAIAGSRGQTSAQPEGKLRGEFRMPNLDFSSAPRLEFELWVERDDGSAGQNFPRWRAGVTVVNPLAAKSAR